MHHAHPAERRHEYLPFIAVRPDIQTCGLGSTLLDHHHTILDLRGTPAYLEAASPASARLYRRHGYRPIREPFGPAGSNARLYPMWREPGAEPIPHRPAPTSPCPHESAPTGRSGPSRTSWQS
ncbi:MAG: GNAT family N-acetyltransferase [Micromonosporaceae bacterium]|nr:GNAT family N-acetyltransferase [Micromonosporaceae bacterium]